jgi:hypothetical protein
MTAMTSRSAPNPPPSQAAREALKVAQSGDVPMLGTYVAKLVEQNEALQREVDALKQAQSATAGGGAPPAGPVAPPSVAERYGAAHPLEAEASGTSMAGHATFAALIAAGGSSLPHTQFLPHLVRIGDLLDAAEAESDPDKQQRLLPSAEEAAALETLWESSGRELLRVAPPPSAAERFVHAERVLMIRQELDRSRLRLSSLPRKK